MSDLAAKTIHKTRPNAGRDSHVIADGVTLYEGALVQLQNGYLNHWDETGEFMGILLAGDDRLGAGVITGETSDSPPPEARLDSSGVILMHLSGVAGTPTQAKVGDQVWCADSNPDNMTLADTGNPPVGWLIKYRSSTDVDVQLYRPGEWMSANRGEVLDSISETIGFGDMTDSSTTGTKVMTLSLPVGAVVVATKVLVPAGFAGDTSAVITVGDGSDVDRYHTGTPDVFTTAATGVEAGLPSGAVLLTSANTPTVIVTTAADFTSVTAGSVTVTIYYIRP